MEMKDHHDNGKLKKRAFTGLLKMTFVLAFLLFIPAFSLHYWQAWTYIFIFVAAMFGIIQYFLVHDKALVERRMRAGSSAEKEPSQKKIQAVNGVLSTAMLVVPALDWNFHWFRPVPTFLCIIGMISVAGGLYFIFKVFQVNSFTSGIIETAEDQKVIDTGLYASVRHPMYSGAVLLFLATPFALGSYLGLLPVSLLIFMMDVRLRHEEKYLQKHLAGYTEYLQKTKYRLLPGIY